MKLLLLTFCYSDKNIISCCQCFIKIILRKSTGNTCAWEQRKLGELGTLKNGMNFSKEAIGIGFPFVNLLNIFGRNQIDIGNLGKAMASPGQLRDYNLVAGDVLFVRSSVKLEGVGEAALVPETLENTTYSGFIIRFRDETGLNNSFKRFVFSTEDVRRQIMSQATDSANKNISQTVLSNLEFYLPGRDEQEAVGTFFANLDALITLHQREESCAASFSASCFGTLKAFFWEQRKFSDFVLRESVFQASSSEYPSVEYEDVVAEEGRLNKDIRQKETQKTGIVFDGTQVLYGKLRPYLHNWLNPDFTGVAVGDWWVLRPVGADKKFLYRLIQTQQFDEVANQSSGSKMPRADWNLVSNTEFIIPSSLDEQRQIAGTFDDLDNLITLHQCKPKSRKGGSHVLYSYQV